MLAALVWFLAGCSRDPPDLKVDMGRRTDVPAPAKSRSLRLAIGTMLSPRETAQDYRKLADYLETRTGHPVQVVQRRSYAETNALLERGEAEVAFVCTGAYIAMRKTGVEILAVPMVNGKTTYASLVVVQKSDDAKSFEQLQGSRFAFVDPLSLTGRLYPEYRSRQVSTAGTSFFSESVFTHSHSGSVDLVGTGRVRAAGIDSLVFERIEQSEPRRVANVRVLERSMEFGIPPFVAASWLPTPLRQSFRTALLEAHVHDSGRIVLAALGFDRFAPGDPAAYDSAAKVHETAADRGTGATP